MKLPSSHIFFFPSVGKILFQREWTLILEEGAVNLLFLCSRCRYVYNVCGIQVLWGEGWLGEKSPNRLLMGTVMEKSLRKLFCDEGLAFKTGQPFAVGPLQDAFKEFSWTWGGQLLLDTYLNKRNWQSEFVLLSSVDLSTRRPGSTISVLGDTQEWLPSSLVCVYHL